MPKAGPEDAHSFKSISCQTLKPIVENDKAAGMLSPRTGLGLETLRPRPRVVWPRGLVYCNVFSSCSVATATVKSVVMKTKDGNVVNEVRSGQEPRKKWETVTGHTGVTTWH